MIKQEFKELFYDRLELEDLTPDELNSFFLVMSRYLNHGRKDEINGRTLEFVEKQLDKLIRFLECIDFSKRDIVIVLTNLPTILNTVDELYIKYLFLGVVENSENSIRRNKLLFKTKDYMVGLQKLCSRYKLLIASKYPHINWNNLVHSSDKEFAMLFIKGKYEKPYQMFEYVDEVKTWLETVEASDLDMGEIKSWAVNRELVEKYEKEEQKRY